MPTKRHELLLPAQIAEFARRLAAGQIPAGGVLLEISSGEDYIGLTELEIAGTGECRLKSNQTKGGQLVWRTARIPKAKAGALFKAFHDEAVWNFPSTRQGIPGERRIRIILRYRNHFWNQTFWLGELAPSSHWVSFHDIVQKTIKILGKGKVLDWAS